MATVKKIKKAQNGRDTSAVPSWASKFRAQEITEMKNPKLAEERRRKEDSTMKAKFLKGRAEDRAKYIKEGYKVTDRPSGSTVYTKQKNGGKSPAWQRKEGKSPSGGLNAKGRASLKAAGHNIKPPQPGGGPRKKSFCARMSGMKKKLTSAKTANDPNSRINKSLRKWKC
jgi:Domain of unknown function (DUF6321)